MNYRHIFHAGNFADLLKHAVLTALLAELTAPGAPPLTLIDSHAGAGLYDLGEAAARRTGEAEAGIARLIAASDRPAAFDALATAVGALNESGWRYYPGSPLLIAGALRPRDRLIACESRREVYEALSETLRAANAQAVREDGWEALARRTPKAPASVLALIDPPYEARDDARRAATAVGAILARNVGAVIALWAPIKDLASYDALVGSIEAAAAGAPVLAVETRLRPPDDPLKMNGCAVLTVNPPAGLAAPAAEAAAWIARALGEAGGLGRAVWVGF